MATIAIAAIVLRHANYRDNDRMLTLLTPQMGRLDVMARGCRRPKSPLLPAAELFATGEYNIYSSKDRYSLTACSIHDSFYPLRMDYNQLNAGVFLLNLAEAAAHPNEPSEPLFELLLRALSYLAYREVATHPLLCAFMMRYAHMLGYKPRLSHCVRCGKRIDGEQALSFCDEEGGLVCARCEGAAVYPCAPITQGEAAWLRAIHQNGFEFFPDLAAGDAPFKLMLQYTLKKIERPIKSAQWLMSQ